MPPRKRTPAASASGRAEKPARLFLYQHLIHAPADSTHIPGPDTAAVMAAINHGERPNGDAYVERTEPRGRSTLVVWAVPVKAA